MVLWSDILNKELLTLRNFFVVTKKFLKAKFDWFDNDKRSKLFILNVLLRTLILLTSLLLLDGFLLLNKWGSKLQKYFFKTCRITFLKWAFSQYDIFAILYHLKPLVANRHWQAKCLVIFVTKYYHYISTYLTTSQKSSEDF